MGRGIVLKCGKTVSPTEIESYLLALPGVKEASVSSGEAPKGGEIPLVARILLDDSGEGLTKSERASLLKEKIDALNHTLPPYKRVSKVRIETPKKQENDIQEE